MLLNGITVTWATPVDAVQLGARMESYVETKAAVHVFKLCAQRAQPGAPLGKLSPELIEMIVTEVQDAAFDKHLQIWHESTRCCANKCRPSEHLSKESCEEMRLDYLVDGPECDLMDEDDCGCEHHFEGFLAELGMGHDEHIEAVDIFLAKVEDNSYTKKGGRFAKCRKIIAKDFGLEAYFTAFRDFELTGGWAYPPATVILAYLILPSMHSTVRTSSGSEGISYLSSAIVDPSILRSDYHTLFKVAMCTLQLEPVPLGQHFTSVVPTSEPLPPAHGHSWYCSKNKEIRDDAARKDDYTSCRIRLTQVEVAASSAWPKLMILGSGYCDTEDD